MKITKDTELSLYKVLYSGSYTYCIGQTVSDAIAGYENPEEIEKIKYIGMAYLSPSLFPKTK